MVLLALLLDVDLVPLGLQVVVGVALVIVQVVVWVNLAPLLRVLVVVPVVERGRGRSCSSCRLL